MFQIGFGSRVALLHESVSDCLSAMTRPKGLTDEESDLLRDISYEVKEQRLKGQHLREISCEVEGVSQKEIESDRRTIVFKGRDGKYYYKPIEQTGVLIQGKDGWYCYTPKNLTEDEETLLNLMSRRLKGQESENGIFWTIYRPTNKVNSEEQEYEFNIAFARKKHSAWSAIYAFSNIAYLNAGSIFPGGGHDYLHLLIVKDILYSILHHTHEEPQDEIINRFSLILLLMDDIEEAVRYSKGGELRGSEVNRCGLDWELKKDEAKVEIELDYSTPNHKNKKEQIAALKGQKEALEKKYKHQICPEKKCNECEKKKRWSEKYKIIIKFLYKGKCHDELEMCLGIG